MMDAVFQSADEEAKGRLLKIMQSFLISECDKHAAIQKGTPPYILHGWSAHLSVGKNTKSAKAINMEELVGNTDGFAESGYVNM